MSEDISVQSEQSEPVEFRKCAYCDATQDTVVIRRCIKCQKFYCPDHQTPVLPQEHYCDTCRPLLITEQLYERTDVVEHYDEVNDRILRETVIQRCNRITFEGPDKEFYSEYIANKTPEDLRKYVIFYKTLVNMMEEEILTKQIKARSTLFRVAGEVSTRPARRKEDKPKKQRVAKPVDPAAFLNTVKNLGLKPEDIAKLQALFGGKK